MNDRFDLEEAMGEMLSTQNDIETIIYIGLYDTNATVINWLTSFMAMTAQKSRIPNTNLI